MKNKFERILLALLLGISVLLGLSFWLNIVFGFNLFFKDHWDELAKLQAEHIPVSVGFYWSIGIAVFIFIIGLCFIYIPILRRTYNKPPVVAQPVIQQPVVKEKPVEDEQVLVAPDNHQSAIPLSRPPRLNLPTNMAQIVSQRQQQQTVENQQPAKIDSHAEYDSVLSQIFTEHNYTVKPNPPISGIKPNLFAIAPNEIIWIGAVDADINKLQSAIDKLQSVFRETLEDIPITVNAFILDTNNILSQTDSVLVFKTIDEIKNFISEQPPVWSEDMPDYDKNNFDAYSEYIDTIIQYLKTIGS